MPIKTEKEETEKNTVVLTVEVPFDEIGDAVANAYRDIALKVKIPGFRKGKAPHAIIDQMVGKEAVLHEAVHELIPTFYPQAVEEAGIDPVSMPEIDVVTIAENEPFVFKAKVQVKPEVKLGDVDALVVEALKQKTLAEEVKIQLERLRNKFASLEVVSGRAAKMEDFILIDYEGYIDGKPFEGGRGSDYMLELGSNTFIAGFEDQLVGAKAGSDKELKITFPDNYHTAHLAGEDAVFAVKVKEIKTKKQPKLDDEFAKSVSKFETLKELKDDLKESAEKKQKLERESALRNGAIAKMVELSEVDVPEGMVSRRVDQMVQEFGEKVQQGQGVSLAEWLSSSGVDMSVMRQSYQNEAEQGLQTELVLEAVFKANGLEATQDDIDNEIKRLAEGAKQDVDELREEINKRDGNEFLKYRLSMNKAIDFLVSKAKVEEKGDADEPSTDSD